MEFANFLKVLLRYKKTLILVPLITVVVTFFLVRNLPNTYKSTARIATGLVERSDEFINKNAIMEGKINQEFSNVIQMMLLKNVVNQVSYQLIIHDLNNKQAPYRKLTKEALALNDAGRKHAVDLFTRKYNKMEELSLFDADQKALNKVLVSMKYDYESLTKKLNVYRLQTSDYIHLEYESENPMLSAFVLNTLTREFVTYNTSIVNQKKDRTVAYLDSSLKAKQLSLTNRMEALKAYKIRNRVLDVKDQANVLMGQIADFQARRQEAQKNISAYSGVLRNIDSKLDPDERNTIEGSVTQANQDILVTRNRLNSLNDDYIKSNFDPKLKTRIDSVQNALTTYINLASNKTTYNTTTAKQDLVKEKMNTEVNLEIAKNSVSSLDNMVNTLTGKLNVLAPNQANIQVYEQAIANESREYEELLRGFNQTKLESSFPIRLRQVEMAMPEAAEPSKKIILVLLAGIVSFLFCVGVLFVMYYVDKSINDTQQLADRTQQPVIGVLSLIKGAQLDPEEFWERNTNEAGSLRNFKSQLRSIRFEVDNDLKGAKIISVTSLQAGEGKTFLALNLAYAYKMINKKVLLIDGNFDNPGISEAASPNLFLEDYLLSGQDSKILNEFDKKFVVMGNKGEDISLLEISNHATIQTKLQALREQFDIILIEIPSLNIFNKAREWVSFSDKVMPVFAAGQNISEVNKKEVDYLKSLGDKLIGWVMNKTGTEKEKSEKAKAVKKAYA